MLQFLKKFILIQESCVLCNAPSFQQICNECKLIIPNLRDNFSCKRCLINLSPLELCTNCKDCFFDNIICSYPYKRPLDKILHLFKYNGNISYTSVLSEMFYEGICKNVTNMPDALLPVPLHPNKHVLRGFNQSYELIRKIQKQYNLPIINAKRIKNTESQAKLSRVERCQNLFNAFSVPCLSNMSIAIVDDVVTTMTTVNELAKMCKQQNAKKVDVWCLMRTV